MKIRSILVALLLVLALVVSATAQARTNENSTLAQAYGSEGREVAAPPRLHDGSRPKPMRGAHVGLWQPRHRRWPNIQAIIQTVGNQNLVCRQSHLTTNGRGT